MQHPARPTESIPARLVAKLRMEKKGRGGKTVTVVYGVPQNDQFLKELSRELKRACGTGEAVVEGGVEVQGDLCERVRAVLVKARMPPLGTRHSSRCPSTPSR